MDWHVIHQKTLKYKFLASASDCLRYHQLCLKNKLYNVGRPEHFFDISERGIRIAPKVF